MKCSMCNKRKAKIAFAESFLELTHGYARQICRQCYINMLKEQMAGIEKTIKEQEKLLHYEKNKVRHKGVSVIRE
jgi:hypothetical protein